MVTDAEHSAGELTYAWQTALHHDNHSHPESPDNNPVTTTTLSPVGCNGVVYWYRITLNVTDAAGLSTTYTKDIYPDCPGPLAVNDLAIFPAIGGSSDIDVLANDVDPNIDPGSVAIISNPNLGSLSQNLTTGVVTYTRTSPGQSDSFSYTVDDLSGATSNVAYVSISELGPPSIAILNPMDGGQVGGNTIVINYELQGDLQGQGVDHLFITLDSQPALEIHDLSGSYTLTKRTSWAAYTQIAAGK